jgi:hypothetical protein
MHIHFFSKVIFTSHGWLVTGHFIPWNMAVNYSYMKKARAIQREENSAIHGLAIFLAFRF